MRVHLPQFRLNGLIRWFIIGCLLIVAVPCTIRAQTPDHQMEKAHHLLQQGWQQYQSSQIRAAIASWQESLSLYRALADRQNEGIALVHLGNAYMLLGEDDAAITSFQAARLIAQAIQNPSLEQAACAGLGEVYYRGGDYAKAIVYRQQEWAIAQQLNHRPGEMVALRNLGITYDALGNYPKAIEFHQRSLAIARELRDRSSESVALRNLGLVYQLSNQYPDAIAAYQKDLEIAQEQGDRAGIGWLLNHLGTAYYYLGDYARSIAYHQQHLTIAQELNDPQSAGLALGGLGIAYYYLGDYARAIAYQQQSLTLAHQQNDPQSVGAALANLGNAYFSLGDYDRAIALYQQGLVAIQASQHLHSQSTILGNLGRAYLFKGELHLALTHHEQALNLARQLRDQQAEGVALGNLGDVYQALGQHDTAIQYGQQWLAIARQLGDRQSMGAALTDLGNAYRRLGNYSQAMAQYEQSLAIARHIRSQRAAGVALDRLGYTLWQAGRLPEAEQTLTGAIQIWESLRAQLHAPTSNPLSTPQQVDANKVSLFDTQATTYRTLQAVLVAQGKQQAALEIAERGRARAFLELLAQRSTLSQRQDNSQTLPSRSTVAPIASPTIQQIQAIARAQNATLVEYSIIANQLSPTHLIEDPVKALYIWVIHPTGKIDFRQVDLRSLNPISPNGSSERTVPGSTPQTPARGGIRITDNAVNGVTNLTFQPEPEQFSAQLKQLHQLLIQPIADLLPTDPQQQIIFIPQGTLFLVPFAALRDNTGAYLIERHTISTTPSIQVLEQTRQLRLKRDRQTAHHLPTSALIVGNPIPMPLSLSPLPGAAVEAKAVAQVLHTSALTGHQATRAAVLAKLPHARWIHFATHGIFDSQRGLGSAIALAPAPGKDDSPLLPTIPPTKMIAAGSPTRLQDDGFLTAEQLLDLNLQAELAVLSACNTGRGRLTGDGVIGLSRALITAGVPSVMVSLWSIPDVPTAVLMTHFYQQLEQNPHKAQALRRAMLATMQQTKRPLDWAGFVLIGEAE